MRFPLVWRMRGAGGLKVGLADRLIWRAHKVLIPDLP